MEEETQGSSTRDSGKVSGSTRDSGKVSEAAAAAQAHHAPYKHKLHASMAQEIELEMHEAELPTPQRYASRILRSKRFEFSMGAIIIFNTVAMIFEIDAMAEEASPPLWTTVCGWIILIIFLWEMTLRLYVLRMNFWFDAWNVFDFIVVAVDAIMSVLGLIGKDLFSVSVLRVLRLAKLNRVSKVLRVFPELRLLIAGLISSVKAIFWGTVLLFVSLLMWSMIAVLFIHPLNKTVDYGESCERCPRAYSSVMQATLTFWQQIVTGDSWGEASIPLIETHPVTALFFVPMFLSIGLAVMNLILGVVVSVAQQAKDQLEEEDHREEVVLREEQHTHLLGLCMEADKEGNGTISHSELHEMYDAPGAFRDALKSQCVTKEQIDIVWRLLDIDHEGEVPYEDVVSAIYKLKESDTHYMLAYIKHYITLVKDTIQRQMDVQHKEDLDMEQRVEEDLRKIEEVEAEQFGVWHTISANLKQQQNTGAAWQALAASEAQQHDGGVWQPLATDQTLHSRSSGGETLQVQSKGIAPVAETYTSRNIVKSFLTDDEEATWLKQVGQRISVLQVELQDIWRDIEGKAQPLVSPTAQPLVSPTACKTRVKDIVKI